LTVSRRRSGVLRSTPDSVLTVNDPLSTVAGLDDADWVLNARAPGRRMLRRGRTEERVALIDLLVEVRAPIPREFPGQNPQGVTFFTRLFGVGAGPDVFAALAKTCPVFHVERR